MVLGETGAPEPAEQGWLRALAPVAVPPQGDTGAGVMIDPWRVLERSYQDRTSAHTFLFPFLKRKHRGKSTCVERAG